MFICSTETKMKKSYKLENLDCANCAAKIEDAIKKIDGIKSASVSFFAQKIEIEFDRDETTLVAEIKKIISKIEPDCELL